jgi:hypothetical protein
MIPKNLLGIALSVLPKTTVQWSAFDSMGVDDRGRPAPTYLDAVPLTGSWQAVDAVRMAQLGLDTTKQYRAFYISKPVDGVSRGTSPDKIEFQGDQWDVLPNADWYAMNGWRSILCVRQ